VGWSQSDGPGGDTVVVPLSLSLSLWVVNAIVQSLCGRVDFNPLPIASVRGERYERI